MTLLANLGKVLSRSLAVSFITVQCEQFQAASFVGYVSPILSSRRWADGKCLSGRLAGEGVAL